MQVEFSKIIQKLKKLTGFNQKQIATHIFDISDKNLSNKIKRNSIDFFKLIRWAVHKNVDLNWLLTENAIKPQKENEASQIDLDTLIQVVKIVDEKLPFEEKVTHLEKKARLISLLYAHFTETEKEVDAETIDHYLKLAT